MQISNIMERLIRMYWRLRFKATGGDVIIGPESRISPLAKIIPRKGKITIGARVKIMHGAVLDTYDGTIALGDDVSINCYSLIYGHGGLRIGNDTRIAAHCAIIPANHVFADKEQLIRRQGETRSGIHIGSDVWLSAGVIILDGSHIADGCVIGANSIVNDTTEPYGVYVGSPAKLIKRRE